MQETSRANDVVYRLHGRYKNPGLQQHSSLVFFQLRIVGRWVWAVSAPASSSFSGLGLGLFFSCSYALPWRSGQRARPVNIADATCPRPPALALACVPPLLLARTALARTPQPPLSPPAIRTRSRLRALTLACTPLRSLARPHLHTPTPALAYAPLRPHCCPTDLPPLPTHPCPPPPRSSLHALTLVCAPPTLACAPPLLPAKPHSSTPALACAPLCGLGLRRICG
jgi:hypothetical protein